MMNLTSRKTLLAAAAAAASLAAPAVAGADSIVYVDAGNVWSAKPDGSHKVQLTDSGGWHSATQADDGTIAAAQGANGITVMAKDGRPLRTLGTKPARTGNGGWFRGTPVNLAFSPDGSKIAYEYTDIACPPASTCGQQHSVFYTAANASGEATPQETYGNQFGASDPEFVTNDRALVTRASYLGFDDLGGGDYSMTQWFTGNTDITDGEFSRDRQRVVFKVGYGADTRLGFTTVTGADPAIGSPDKPTGFVCGTDADEKLADPTWSPDGAGVAYESKKGIELVRFGRYAIGDCDVVGESVLTATGSGPDWGPADPPAKRYAGAGSAGTPASGPAPAAAPAPAPAKAASGSTVKATAKAPKRFRSSLTVSVTSAKAGGARATATVKVGRRTVKGTASRTVAAGKTTALVIRFRGSSATAVRKALRRKALVAKIAVQTPSGATATTVRLARQR